MKVEIEKIVIDPNRQRKDMGDIAALAESLKKYGQLQNVVIDQDFKLVCGERRIRAAQLLKWQTVEAKFKNQITELEAEEMELEENIQREQLSWDEQVNAKARIHALKIRIHGGQEGQGRPKGLPVGTKQGWSMQDTAAMLGESLGGVSQDIALAKAMLVIPSLKNEPTKKAAVRKLKVIQERLILNELARRANARPGAEKDNVQLLNISCTDYIKTLADESIDLILTDPPYAINIDQMGGVGWIWSRNFEDVFNDRQQYEEANKQIQFGVWKGASACDDFVSIIPDLVRVLKTGNHCFVFCAMENFPIYANAFTDLGMTVRSRPLIWLKSTHTFTSFFWKFSGRYELILAAYKGSEGRVLNMTSDDILQYDAPKQRIHATEKPVDLLSFLINLTTSPGETVFDPFAGSGSTLRACRMTKRGGIGCEIDAEMVKKAQGQLFI